METHLGLGVDVGLVLEEEAADLRVTLQGGVVEGRPAQCSEVGSQHWECPTQNRGGVEQGAENPPPLQFSNCCAKRPLRPELLRTNVRPSVPSGKTVIFAKDSSRCDRLSCPS